MEEESGSSFLGPSHHHHVVVGLVHLATELARMILAALRGLAHGHFLLVGTLSGRPCSEGGAGTNVEHLSASVFKSRGEAWMLSDS